MKSSWFNKIQTFCEIYDDLPDGAFFALAEEQGITIDDWSAYADECELKKGKK